MSTAVAAHIVQTISSVCQCIPAIKQGYTWNLWMGEFFGDCVYTPREYFSFLLGLVTLVLNAISLTPQIWLNYKNKKTDGLSVSLLVIWIVADLCSLVGCLLTDQLVTQTLLAIYFVFVDGVTLFQCWYYAGNSDSSSLYNSDGSTNSSLYTSDIPLDTYTVLNLPITTKSSFGAGLTGDFNGSDDVNSDIRLEQELLDPKNNDLSPLLSPSTNNNSSQPSQKQSLLQLKQEQQERRKSASHTPPVAGSSTSGFTASALAIVGMMGLIGMVNVITPETAPAASEAMTAITEKAVLAMGSLPTCLRSPQVDPSAIYIGIIISWISGFLYCSSRAPQIKSNYDFYKLGIPLDGLAPSVFVITALGNISYGVSVLLRNTIDREFWIKTSPFLLGSFGTIIFDIVILIQIYYYNSQYQKRKEFISTQYGEDEL